MTDNTPDAPTKQCTKCGETFPATTEFWHKHKLGKYGLRSICRACRNKISRQYNAKHRERISERDRKLRKNNPYKFRERERQYYKTHREEKLERSRQWQRANPDKVRAKSRRWAKANPAKVNANARNHRAMAVKAEGSHTSTEIWDQYQRQKGKCYWCGGKLPKRGWHADHVIPLNKGGDNYITNIVCTCSTCNCSKQDKLPHEWKGGGGRLL